MGFKGWGKSKREGAVPGFARGRGNAAFRDPNAEVDPAAIPCGENPAGVSVHQGALYIAESVNDRIVCIKEGMKVVVAGGNGKGYRADQLDRPFRIFVNDDGVYVADRNNARVQLWRHGASTGETVAGGNGPGHGANQLNQPAGVALDGNHIYVADRANHRIMRWQRGCSREGGVLVAGGNGFGCGAHQLGCPGALCILNSLLYVSDESNARIQCWVPGDKEGITVAGGCGNGSNLNQLYHPLGISTLDGDLIVCDSTNHRVQRQMLASGTKSDAHVVASTICGGFGIGSGVGQLGHPMDCHWDGQCLYVSDWYHACIRTYTSEVLSSHSEKLFAGQRETLCDGKRYIGRVVEWRDHSGYGFIIDDKTGRKFMAHNSDIANSLVQYGYAVLTEGEDVEYCLLRDIVGKWKCDAVTAVGGGPVSANQIVVDMSINSGSRHCEAKREKRKEKSTETVQRLSMREPDSGPDASLEAIANKSKGRRWIKKRDANITVD